jgi:hypothetical protein
VLAGDRLSCGCGAGYDVRRGGRADGAPAVRSQDAEHLAPLPLLPEQGAWKVCLPARVGA